MPKITFLGAGSSVFAKRILGDVMLREGIEDVEFALYDIDAGRLADSKMMIEHLNANINSGRAKVSAHLGPDQRRDALAGASYVVNAIQVGGYEPSTVIDFEIPRKYGLRQTIADTLGIGGIFRGLRTIPVMLDFARDIEAVCPDAWLLNYTNPMAIVTGAVQRHCDVRCVGLCHSVQVVVKDLLEHTGLVEEYDLSKIASTTAGINHMAWLLRLELDGEDLYPRVKQRAGEILDAARREGSSECPDLVRQELMMQFGYYVTESSEHLSEYVPWMIRRDRPELIDRYQIPLDEYPRRCREQIELWTQQRKDLVENKALEHELSHEYGSGIIQAMETDRPYRIGGNVPNTGLIPNLPPQACVEVPCLVDRNGVQGTYVGDLPEQCAALNRTQINVQLMTIEAAVTGRRDHVYQAAMLDPHTAAELTIDEIRALCDELIEAHGAMLPKLA